VSTTRSCLLLSLMLMNRVDAIGKSKTVVVVNGTFANSPITANLAKHFQIKGKFFWLIMLMLNSRQRLYPPLHFSREQKRCIPNRKLQTTIQGQFTNLKGSVRTIRQYFQSVLRAIHSRRFRSKHQCTMAIATKVCPNNNSSNQ